MQSVSERIVVLGGGTGLFQALSGLRRHDVELTAIVSPFRRRTQCMFRICPGPFPLPALAD